MLAIPVRLLSLFALLCLLPIPAYSQPDTPTPPLAGIAHVAIRVHNLATSASFYEKLGFEQAFDLRNDNVPDQIFLKINDFQFIVLYPTTTTQPTAGFLHLCFATASLEAVSQDYFSHGLTPTAIRKTSAGNLLFTLPGPIQPSGPQNIEYLQYQPGSRDSDDIGKHLGSDRVADKLIAVSLAMNDPDAARDFYINQLNFKPIAGDQMNFHMPGNSGQEVEIVSASLGSQAHFTLNSDNLGRAARHLHKEGVPVEKNGASLTLTDPDGNIILIESR
jgi:catechol 2,3-dioxygenase-like lactoylglutathione lyase family enzyme